MCSFFDHLLTFSQTFSYLLVSLRPEDPGWTHSSECSLAEGLCTPLKLLPVALVPQYSIQSGSAAYRVHCRLELPLLPQIWVSPACPGPFPQSSWCCWPVSHTAQQASSPAPFPDISPCPPSSHQARSPARLGPSGDQLHPPAHPWKSRLLLWHSHTCPFQGLPTPLHSSQGLCPAQVTAERLLFLARGTELRLSWAASSCPTPGAWWPRLSYSSL